MKALNVYLPKSIKVKGISHAFGLFNRRRPIYVRKNQILHVHASSLKD